MATVGVLRESVRSDPRFALGVVDDSDRKVRQSSRK